MLRLRLLLGLLSTNCRLDTWCLLAEPGLHIAVHNISEHFQPHGPEYVDTECTSRSLGPLESSGTRCTLVHLVEHHLHLPRHLEYVGALHSAAGSLAVGSPDHLLRDHCRTAGLLLVGLLPAMPQFVALLPVVLLPLQLAALLPAALLPVVQVR